MRPQTRQRLQAAYDFISDYWQQYGYAPTMTEIGMALGVSQQGGTAYVERLAALRFVRYQRRKLRTVEITPRVCGKCGQEITLMNARMKWDKTRGGGKWYVQNVCMPCTLRINRDYYYANHEQFLRRLARYRKYRKQPGYAERLRIAA